MFRIIIIILPYSSQNDRAFQATHRPDDSTVERFAKRIHEYFYRKMLRHEMICLHGNDATVKFNNYYCIRYLHNKRT